MLIENQRAVFGRLAMVRARMSFSLAMYVMPHHIFCIYSSVFPLISTYARIRKRITFLTFFL